MRRTRKVSDMEKIENVCRDLENENKGFGARVDFWCCQTCGHAAMDNNGTKQYIFAHEQSMESAFGVITETRYYTEDGEEVEQHEDYYDVEEETYGYNDTFLTGGKLHFHHHIKDQKIKEAVVKAFNAAGFLVEWKDFDDSQSIVIHP